MSLNYHILNLKGLVDLLIMTPNKLNFVVWDGALVIVHPCRSNSRDRVYWHANYQLIVQSTTSSVSWCQYLCLIVREFLYVPIAIAADIFLANENRLLIVEPY